MSHNILVPLDGSPFAERVLPLAAALACKLGIPLELALVHPPVVLGYSQDMRHATMDAETEDEITAEQDYLMRTASRLGDALATVRWTLLASRSIPEALCERAIASDAAFIAMTTHGRTGLRRSVLGSVADAVVHRAPIPVLLWRSTAIKAAGSPTDPFRTVLVPLDGSAAAESILAPAATLAGVGDCHVLLVQVVPPVSREVPVAHVEAHADTGGRPGRGVAEAPRTRSESYTAQAYLLGQAARLGAQFPQLLVDTRVLRDANAGAGILRAADDAGADLVAMTSAGHGASRVFMGSTVDAVLRDRAGAVLVRGMHS